METEIKGRIYVKTEDFEGYGTVLDVFRGEIFPVQIELEQPDENGHSVHRVRYNEIVRGEIASNDAEPEQIRYIARVSKPRNGYHVGDEYIVGAAKHQDYFNVFLMNGNIVGSYVNDFFERIRPYVEQKEVAPVPVEPIQEKQEPVMSGSVKIDKGGKPKITITHISYKKAKPEKPKREKKETIIPGQMDIFDFI